APLAAFELSGLETDVPRTIVARKDFPGKGLKEVVSYVNANKGKGSYDNAGIGTASRLSRMLLINSLCGAMTTVPDKGSGQAMNDLLGEEVDLMCDQTTNTSS